MQFQKLSIPLHSLSTRKQVDYKVAFWRDGRVVDYNGLENRRTERYRGFESLSLRFRYSEQTNREILTKNVSIIATSSYDTFLLYPSYFSEYVQKQRKLPKCSKKATIRLHIFKAK